MLANAFCIARCSLFAGERREHDQGVNLPPALPPGRRFRSDSASEKSVEPAKNAGGSKCPSRRCERDEWSGRPSDCQGVG